MTEREKALREALAAVGEIPISPFDKYGKGVEAAYGKIKALLSQPTEDGWIPWSGGECPVDPETRVEVKIGNGVDAVWANRADYYSWRHAGVADITAYRVIEPEKDRGLVETVKDAISDRQYYEQGIRADPLDRPVTVREFREAVRSLEGGTEAKVALLTVAMKLRSKAKGA